MKKYTPFSWLLLFTLGCSFTASPTSTPMPAPTSTPSTGWYGYESTELIDESYWTPKNAESPELYKFERTEQTEEEFNNPNQPFQIIEKDGKTFLDDGNGFLLYFPKDLNINLVNDALNIEHLNADGSTQYAQMIVTIYYHGYNRSTDTDYGQFRVVTKVFIKQFPK